MNKDKLNYQLFETLLKAAVEEDFQRELDTLPPEADLRKKYEPSPKLTRQIREALKEEKRRGQQTKIVQAAKKAAVITAILIPVTFGGLLSVEASRNIIFNSIMEWKAGHVDLYFQPESQMPEDNGDVLYKPTYLPDGYVEKESVKFGVTQRITYENERKDLIIFDQISITSGKKSLDTEHNELKEIIINGKKAYLFVSDKPDIRSYIVWEGRSASFKLSSNLGQKELIKIVQNVEIAKK